VTGEKEGVENGGTVLARDKNTIDAVYSGTRLKIDGKRSHNRERKGLVLGILYRRVPSLSSFSPPLFL